jgi:hypothetical protein
MRAILAGGLVSLNSLRMAPRLRIPANHM